MAADDVSVQLKTELAEKLTELARVLDRPTSWLIERAIEDFVAVQEWQLAAIDEGVRAADAGQNVPHDPVAAWAASLGQPAELPLPDCK
jgi:predicted transcriptional regulator